MKAAICSMLLILIVKFTHADIFTVATFEWDPFVNAQRPDSGISIAIIKATLESQGHEIKLVPMTWARALVMLEKNKIDILPAVWFSEERAKIMEFSDSYASNRIVFIKNKSNDYEYNGLASLHNKTVGVVRDYAYGNEFLNDPQINLSVSNSLISNVKKVIAGRVNLTLEDEIVAKTIIPPDLLKEVAFTQNALNEKPLYMTCSKSNEKCKAIITSFNQGLSIMKTNGQLDQLLSAPGVK